MDHRRRYEPSPGIGIGSGYASWAVRYLLKPTASTLRPIYPFAPVPVRAFTPQTATGAKF